MLPMKNYLIWREKNDFFSALSTFGILYTWSLATGDLVYKKDVKKAFKINVTDFEVYQGNSKDYNYCKDFYCF